MELRHPTEEERESVQVLVQAVVDEVYGGLWTTAPVPIGATDWTPAWVAVDETGLAGVALTSGEWVDDLWIAAKARGGGIGSALLSRCEAEIRDRGINHARLRVVSTNRMAINFYEAEGWTAEREYDHESLPVKMLDMGKTL